MLFYSHAEQANTVLVPEQISSCHARESDLRDVSWRVTVNMIKYYKNTPAREKKARISAHYVSIELEVEAVAISLLRLERI